MNDLEKMYEWLGAVEFLITAGGDCSVENDFGDYIKIGSMCAGRYEKYDRNREFCGVTDSAAEAVLWLYENNSSNEEYDF